MVNLCHQALVLLALVYVTLAGEDFYALLGVDKGASVKEIRKAFKKLAISKHPDKNADKPEAHDEFIKINRAYEVLKDEELRKRYDQFGEEGLKDEQQRGRRYESWQWYQQNFGEELNFILLAKNFYILNKQSVEGTGEPWFINFYSTYCSHCHDLAPTKRKYHGERSTDAMVDEALRNVKATRYELKSGNFKAYVEDEDNLMPWLITFCGDGGGESNIFLFYKWADLVKVGRIHCDTDADLCKKLGRQHGTFFYTAENVRKDQGYEVTSLDAQEIAKDVLQQLPDMEILDAKQLAKIVDRFREDTWLVHFVDNPNNHDLELRKLPALLQDYRVGRVDCSKMHTACLRLHVVKYPTFILFKEQGGREVYYGGRVTAHDVSAFVHDSADAPMENLSPEDFPDRVVLSQDPWFVDFFAPWCPPCMRLLPEFKKASKFSEEDVNFGTVDCTVHAGLCNKYNIHSYPTTIFYNASVPHQYHGHHTAKHLLEFIEDTMRPPVISLSRETFMDKVYNKPEDEVWLVDFFAPWCGPCQQLAPEWRKLAKMLKDTKKVYVAQVDCQAQQSLCQSQGVRSYPLMRLYPTGSTKASQHYKYNGWHRDAGSLRNWAYEFLPSKVVTLTSSNFQQLVLESSSSWIVDYYAPWCGHCQVFRPEFERVAEAIEDFAKAGKVDCDSEPNICNKAAVRAYPTVRFYKGSKRGERQHANGWDIQSQSAEEIIKYMKTHSSRPQKTKDEL
ncbi:dnaJ homolog subfamily C member 10 [Aplysia californica]|uniref:DnaJ homolog subfamily C member 10 n=1 Tax=Aplysia californica TaxID=6500 RepID=A0ABM1W2Q3_APLCA|nr:dnaJ homolog subfamily C member 10 [Aplysia californica]